MREASLFIGQYVFLCIGADKLRWNKNITYFVPKLDVDLCQVLDLSEEFTLSEHILLGNKIPYESCITMLPINWHWILLYNQIFKKHYLWIYIDIDMELPWILKSVA